MKDNIQNYNESFKKLIDGVNKVTDIIKPTYGASGGNVIIEENLRPFHRIANDGKLITDSIWLTDPVEKMGANILREVCEKQEKEAGDGRKTTCILTAAILNKGLEYKDSTKPLEIKKSLDECLPIIINHIDEQKKEITPEEIEPIARVASESEELGRVIAEIYPKIGKEGIIEIDTSNLPKTYYEIVDGFRIRTGWFGGYWQTEEGKCTISNPKILISKDKITSVSQIESIYVELSRQKINELVIYCEDIDLAVASRLALTSVKGDFKTLIIKAPILWKDWIYEDLVQMTGAIAVDSKVGKTFKGLSVNDLGTCEKLVATKDEVRVIGIKDIKGHIEKLKEKGLVDDQELVRVSWLNTKVAVLKVGANSESELSWKLRKAKDGASASYYALRDGVVKGAGESITNIELPITIGGTILRFALTAPQNVLVENSGKDLKDNQNNGILDPALVIKSAITNAISVAGIILTLKGAITIPQELKDLAKSLQPAI